LHLIFSQSAISTENAFSEIVVHLKITFIWLSWPVSCLIRSNNPSE
jgi:hypothetical protein